MALRSPPTGYARLTPRQARAVLGAVALVSAFCVGITLSPLANTPGEGRGKGGGDIALYRAIVDRVHSGEGYYEAAAGEMIARGYPTRSVFNWRSPLPHWMLGQMPAVVLGEVLLALLALGVMVAGFEALAREQGHGLGRPIGCALLLSGPMMPCVLGNGFVSPELWAGVLIALSICAYGLNRPYLGVVTGLAAVFFRELAMPYCVVAVGLAWHGGRQREVWAWTVGLGAWLVFYGLHCGEVLAWIPSGAVAHSQGWVRLGGAAFVISTVQMNAYLILLPQWVTALYFMASMLGLAGWHTPLGLRTGLTVSLFVTAFSMVGQEFNQYWGSLAAPLFCFGLVRFPGSLRDLLRAAWLGRTGRPIGPGSWKTWRKLADLLNFSI